MAQMCMYAPEREGGGNVRVVERERGEGGRELDG